MFITAFLLWFGLGYLLFLMGLAYNTIAIMAYVIAYIILAFGAYTLNRWLKVFQEKRIIRMMALGCSYFRFAINVRSNLTDSMFDFHKDDIAQEFVVLNSSW